MIEINAFNNIIIDSDKYKTIRNYLIDNSDSDKIYNLCHFAFLIIDPTKIFKSESTDSEYQIFIPETKIKEVAVKLVDFIKNDLTNYEDYKESLINDLINIIKDFHKETATDQEIKERTVGNFDWEKLGHFGLIGNICFCTEIPNWNEFENRLRVYIKELI